MITPREYQLEALEAVSEFHSRGIGRQLVCLPTGTGKTVIFALLAKEHNVRTLVLAHSEELISQAVSKFKVVWPEVDIGIVKAESDDVNCHVVIASVQTATRDVRLQKLKEQDFGLMIIDEAHHSAAPSYEKIVRELGFLNDNSQKLLVGVTATPKRGDGIALNTIFQEISFERSISTMIRAGYLAPLLGKQVFTKVALEQVTIRHGDFVVSELSRAVNTPSRNQLIVDNFKTYAADRKKGLAFCADVQHAKDVAAIFNKNGIKAAAVYGAMSDEERAQTLDDFSKGKFRVLTNCQLLTEGFDSPEVDCVIMGRPTKSSALYIQMIGRGTRTHPLKRNCLVLDFCDNATRNDLCFYKNTLDGIVAPLNPFEDDVEEEGYVDSSEEEIVENPASEGLRVLQEKVEDIEFFNNSHFSWTPVGDSWHLQLASDRDVWARQVKGGFLCVAHADGQTINLSSRPLPLDYGLGVCEDWARKQTTKSAWARKDAAWRGEPASAKQISTLEKLGIEYDSRITKGQACLLLDVKMNEPATAKQLYWLKSRSIEFDPSLTKFEARKLIASNQSV